MYSDVELRIVDFMRKADSYLHKFKRGKISAKATTFNRRPLVHIEPTKQELNVLIAELEYIKKRIYGGDD